MTGDRVVAKPETYLALDARVRNGFLRPAAFLRTEPERLLYKGVFAGGRCLAQNLHVGVVTRANDHRIHVWVVEHFLQVGGHVVATKLLLALPSGFFTHVHQCPQAHVWVGHYVWQVAAADRAAADDCNI